MPFEQFEQGFHLLLLFLQISQSKYWCFTWNNPKLNELEFQQELTRFSSSWIFGKEEGASGTPHYQGYIEFDKKIRPMSLKLSKEIHWEKRKGTRQQATDYCAKDGLYFCRGLNVTEKIETIQDLRPWQAEVVKMLEDKPDPRKIYWFWDEEGGTGKSSLVKYLVINHGAMMFSGKASDAKYGIASLDHYPRLVIMDIPRATGCVVSYQGMEEIKNACFFSSKYEGKMVVGNPPHMLVFANCEPDYIKMSQDRWVVKNID